jgi:hypothetical protein
MVFIVIRFSGKVAAISLVISLLYFPVEEILSKIRILIFILPLYSSSCPFVCGNQFESCIIIQNWFDEHKQIARRLTFKCA